MVYATALKAVASNGLRVRVSPRALLLSAYNSLLLINRQEHVIQLHLLFDNKYAKP